MAQTEIREDDVRTKVEQLRAGINAVINGEKGALRDMELIKSMPATVEHFFARGKGKVAETVLDRLGVGLVEEAPEFRAAISESLAVIGDKMLSEKRIYPMLRLSRRTVDWIRLESSATPTFQKICEQLRDLVKNMIIDHRFAECEQILETFNLIHTGFLKREDEIMALAGEVMAGIADDKVMDVLLAEFHRDDGEIRKQVAYILVQLGPVITERFLDILERSEDMSERIQILRLVSEIGSPAAPILIKRIRFDVPWYYLRNLILLLGKVGDESHLKVLEPHLDHEDYRVRRETLDSIRKIGGSEADDIILSILPSTSGRFRISVVQALGAMKSREAVAPLLDLLESEDGSESDDRNKLAENICKSLGEIGSQKAIPALIELLKQDKKDVSLVEPYDDKVRETAARALVKIGNSSD